MESECKIDCDISYDIVSDLLGLTMLVYDYGKKFTVEPKQTIESFISTIHQNSDILSSLSESRQEVIKRLARTSAHGKVVNFISEKETDIQVGITTSELNKRISIVFRGSESKADWYHDLKIIKYKLDNGVYVHKGFYDQLHTNGVYNRILTLLRVLLNAVPDYSIYVCGHSLGAALSTLCGYELSRDIPNKITVVNFASPRVGNNGFKEECNKKTNLCIYRITNDRDIVTCAPFINYKHVGTNIHVSESNINIYKDCSYPWWMYSLWRCWRVSDHDVDLYYTRLKKHKW